MAESAQERTEEATPKRKRDARKKGSVAKSSDLISALSMGAVLFVLPAIVGKIGEEWMKGFHQGMRSIPLDVSSGSLQGYVGTVAVGPFAALLPLLFVAMTVGVIGNVAQVGFMLTPEALAPKWERLNPLAGFKRQFSRVSAMEGFKASLKTVFFGYLCYGVVRDKWDDLAVLSWTNPQALMHTTGDILHTAGVRVVVSWLAIAGLDYFFQRRNLDRNLRMSKEEVKQEFKESEQSPELKMAMARRRRQLSRGRGLKAVQEASVIVTNPTHYAVALKYEPGQMHAPQVVAKGVDFLAAKIREEAEHCRIPIVPNPPLARKLYRTCEVGDFIPKDMFQAVAEVLAFVYRTVKRTL